MGGKHEYFRRLILQKVINLSESLPTCQIMIWHKTSPVSRGGHSDICTILTLHASTFPRIEATGLTIPLTPILKLNIVGTEYKQIWDFLQQISSIITMLFSKNTV